MAGVVGAFHEAPQLQETSNPTCVLGALVIL